MQFSNYFNFFKDLVSPASFLADNPAFVKWTLLVFAVVNKKQKYIKYKINLAL